MSGPAAAANNRSGAGASAPVPAFKLLDLTVIGRGNLLAQGRFQMPSGLIVTGNVLRARKDPSKIFVAPAAFKQGGGYFQVVDFASPELKEAWSNAALEAVRPRWKEIMGGPARQEAGDGNF